VQRISVCRDAGFDPISSRLPSGLIPLQARWHLSNGLPEARRREVLQLRESKHGSAPVRGMEVTGRAIVRQRPTPVRAGLPRYPEYLPFRIMYAASIP
jgi:hypothetical protein